MNHQIPPPGWLAATPLAHFSSLHELSLLPLIGLPIPWPKIRFFLQFDFNLHTPFQIHPQALLTFHVRDMSTSLDGRQPCFWMQNINRWSLDLSPYRTMDAYVKGLTRWHRCNYEKSRKLFTLYGCEASLIEGDWSEHALRAYQLYANVAKKHKESLYDYPYFQAIAKRPDYKLICAWFQGEMVAMFLLEEEGDTIHSTCCGMDYHHSTASCAYSWLHYALIEQAIGRHKTFDVGISADNAKQAIGFTPIPSSMDIYSKSGVIRSLLRFLSRFVSATITPEAKVKWRFAPFSLHLRNK